MSQTSGLALIGLELRFSGRPWPRCARQAVGVCVCARGYGAWARGDAKTGGLRGTRNKRGKAAELSMRVLLCPVCVCARECVPLQHG